MSKPHGLQSVLSGEKACLLKLNQRKFLLAKAPAINGQQRRVTTTYIDSARQVIVASDLNAENDKLLKTRTTTDCLGRPVLTEQTEDGTNYTISAQNAYLDMGRVTLSDSMIEPLGNS